MNLFKKMAGSMNQDNDQEKSQRKKCCMCIFVQNIFIHGYTYITKTSYYHFNNLIQKRKEI